MINLAGLGKAAAASIFISGIVFGTAVRAQEISEEHIAAAKQAISTLGVTDRFDDILPGLAERLKSELIQASPNVEDAITTTVDSKALELASRRADLEREAALTYARAFSLDELKAISTFYGSEAGKKLLKDGPIATRELMKAADIWAAGINRDLNTSSMAELQKVAGADLQPLPANSSNTGGAPGATAAPAPAAPAAKPKP